MSEDGQKCPNCSSDDYIRAELEDLSEMGIVYFSCMCKHCGVDFKEVYKFVYNIKPGKRKKR